MQQSHQRTINQLVESQIDQWPTWQHHHDPHQRWNDTSRDYAATSAQRIVFPIVNTLREQMGITDRDVEFDNIIFNSSGRARMPIGLPWGSPYHDGSHLTVLDGQASWQSPAREPLTDHEAAVAIGRSAEHTQLIREQLTKPLLAAQEIYARILTAVNSDTAPPVMIETAPTPHPIQEASLTPITEQTPQTRPRTLAAPPRSIHKLGSMTSRTTPTGPTQPPGPVR